MRCRGTVSDINSGGVTSQSYSFFLNYPTYYVNPSGTIAQVSTFGSVFTDEKAVFDEYRVVDLTVKYLPWVNGQLRVNTAVAFTAPSNPLLVMSVDYDDSTIWTSDAKALNAQNPAMYHAYTSSMKVQRMQQRDKVDAEKWLNFQAIAPSLTSPPDPNNPSKLSAVKVRKFGYQLNATTEGTFILEWTVLVRGVYTLA